MQHLIITGASGGVASALAQQARASGWQVVAVSRDLGKVAWDAQLRIQADVSSPEGVAQVFSTLREAGVVATTLAHMAGSTLIAPIGRTSAQQYRDVMAANADSAFYMLQGFIGALKAAGSPGAAVLASSVVAQMGTPNHEAIAAAKGAVEAMVRAAAATHAASGIRINAVAPGLTETPMTQGITKSPAMREGAAKQYPLNGLNTAHDVAGLVHWLLSDQAQRITGQVWAVDGGFTTIRPLVK